MGDEDPGVAAALTRLAELLHGRGELPEAKALYARSLRIYEKAGEKAGDKAGEKAGDKAKATPGAPAGLARTLTGSALVDVELGERDAAGRALERALLIHGEGEADPSELAKTRFALARWLWSERAERGRARELARLARDGYRDAGGSRAELMAVEAWLAKH